MTHIVAPLMVLVLVGGACGGEDPDVRPEEPARPVGTTDLRITTAAGTVDLHVEVADDPEERAVGLMHREALDPFDGMAFLWDEPVHTSFWMKDTLIPLSIAFWDEQGRIVSILDMEPCDADPCPTYGPGEEFLGAVEVERGLFAERGVEVGDRVEIREPAE
ncbi:MAG TPA: DUF192 domain-containing protein [Actinomycetota bacterium]|nr:DUF192 domain-containing protein [Actinomycetota bacterium]